MASKNPDENGRATSNQSRITINLRVDRTALLPKQCYPLLLQSHRLSPVPM
jgi:hypothetical protein